MARNKQEDPPAKTDGWMSTFSDLMNLLLCFFVLLFAMSSVDANKWEQIVASFTGAEVSILDSGGDGLDDGMLIASGASQLTQLSEYYSKVQQNQEGAKDDIEDAIIKIEEASGKESESMAEVIEQILDRKGISDQVEIQVSQHYVCLNMKGDLLFQSAKADLTDKAKNALNGVADVLKAYDSNLIEIEGHTDNIPMYSEKYPSNDVLSDYRALEVFNYLVERGVSPEKVKHSGRGEYVPVADNSTPEGRAQNRRVEIKIYNSFSSY